LYSSSRSSFSSYKSSRNRRTFNLCQFFIEEFEAGCSLWKSDSFWVDEIIDYNSNVVGTMLLAEVGLNKNIDTV
jgi:hypothetical protein